MIAQDAPPPPKGVLTLKEEEKLNKLRQDRHDAAREERELLLFVRGKAPPDYRYTEGFGRFEHLVEGMTDREREGFSLLIRTSSSAGARSMNALSPLSAPSTS
jgi:hypothetical protein